MPSRTRRLAKAEVIPDSAVPGLEIVTYTVTNVSIDSDADVSESEQEDNNVDFENQVDGNWGSTFTSEHAHSRWKPPSHSRRWLRMGDSNITEKEEGSTLVMDAAILAERMETFRAWVHVFLTELIAFLSTFDAYLDNLTLIPVMAMVLAVLKLSQLEYVVNVLCESVLPEAQYILTDPNFHPSMLLMLPKISKDTFWRGIYVDLLFCTVTNLFLA